jgi:hypothetical protein
MTRIERKVIDREVIDREVIDRKVMTGVDIDLTHGTRVRAGPRASSSHDRAHLPHQRMMLDRTHPSHRVAFSESSQGPPRAAGGRRGN